MPTIHLLIKGKVQGVFYRASAKKIALELNLEGWIKNREDGNVEAVVTGTETGINQFVGWCSQGPAKASVTSLTKTEITSLNFSSFTIK